MRHFVLTELFSDTTWQRAKPFYFLNMLWQNAFWLSSFMVTNVCCFLAVWSLIISHPSLCLPANDSAIWSFLPMFLSFLSFSFFFSSCSITAVQQICSWTVRIVTISASAMHALKYQRPKVWALGIILHSCILDIFKCQCVPHSFLPSVMA